MRHITLLPRKKWKMVRGRGQGGAKPQSDRKDIVLISQQPAKQVRLGQSILQQGTGKDSWAPSTAENIGKFHSSWERELFPYRYAPLVSQPYSSGWAHTMSKCAKEVGGGLGNECEQNTVYAFVKSSKSNQNSILKLLYLNPWPKLYNYQVWNARL